MHTKKSGFLTIEAARDDLKAQGFTAVGPYAREWTHPDGTVFILGKGSLQGRTGQSARGLRWIFGYYPK